MLALDKKFVIQMVLSEIDDDQMQFGQVGRAGGECGFQVVC